ncbi:unnamed protein product, partial [Notodromas monacha]
MAQESRGYVNSAQLHEQHYRQVLEEVPAVPPKTRDREDLLNGNKTTRVMSRILSSSSSNNNNPRDVAAQQTPQSQAAPSLPPRPNKRNLFLVQKFQMDAQRPEDVAQVAAGAPGCSGVPSSQRAAPVRIPARVAHHHQQQQQVQKGTTGFPAGSEENVTVLGKKAVLVGDAGFDAEDIPGHGTRKKPLEGPKKTSTVYAGLQQQIAALFERRVSVCAVRRATSI